MMAEALKLANRAEDKRQIIAVLAESRDPAALPLIAPLLDDTNLVEEACVAALKIAGGLDPRHADAMAPVLQRAIKTAKNPDLQAQARQLLERLKK
jgi:hypothetical protein